MSNGKEIQPRRRKNGKRVQRANEVLMQTGHCPIKKIINLSLKAEKQGKLETAMSGWKEILAYVQPKFKAIDPLEQAQKAKDIMSLEDLNKLKQAVIAGDIDGVQAATPQVIEAEIVGDDLL